MNNWCYHFYCLPDSHIYHPSTHLFKITLFIQLTDSCLLQQIYNNFSNSLIAACVRLPKNLGHSIKVLLKNLGKLLFLNKAEPPKWLFTLPSNIVLCRWELRIMMGVDDLLRHQTRNEPES